jgi:hypothetical protein
VPWKSEVGRLCLVAQRDVPPDISQRQIEEEVPFNWKVDETLWGYVNRYMLKGSGAGFITPPYTAYWDRIWGAMPIEDLPKYKDLYTFTPYIKASIDVTVNLALSNGFELQGGEDVVREWLTDWFDEHNVLQTLRVSATDMLVFGTSFTEICKDNALPPEEWQLKPLDPVHMRVRRDAFGNVFGYIQMLTFPPVVFKAQDIMPMRWGAKSWWYEWSYGTSLLRPLLKIQALIDQFEDDMGILMHTYTKPMLVVKAGTPENPFSDLALAALAQTFRQREQATDVFVRGDVAVDVVHSLTGEIKVDQWINYLLMQREAVLGVPKIFLGQSEGTNRATAEVVMQEYVTRLRMIQEIKADTLETVLMKQLIDAKFGPEKEIPKVKWNPIWEPTIQDKAKFICDLVDRALLGFSEARLQLGFPEVLPQGDTLWQPKQVPALPLLNKGQTAQKVS